MTLAGVSLHTGVTTINAGTLRITADSGLGGAPANSTAGRLVLAGGTLGTTATFDLHGNRGITTGGTIEVAAGTTLTYGGIAAGSGSLIKSGTGTLVLSGTNSYTGATSINAGNLAVNGSLAASAISVDANAILSGIGTVGGSVTVQDGATIRAGNGTSGSLQISGSLTFAGDGSIEIGTLANYTGSTAAIRVTGNLIPSDTTAGAITLSLPTGMVSNGTYRLVSHGSNNLSTSNFGAFAINGPTLGARQSGVLSNGSNDLIYTVSGDTPYWTGTAGSAWNTSATNWRLITAQTNTQFLTNDNVLFNDNATGTTTIDVASDVNPLVTRFENENKSYVLQGAAGIAAGSLGKLGSGTLTITNANSYDQGTTLAAGVLRIGNNGALGSGVLNLSGGTLSSNSTASRNLANPIAIGGNIVLGSGVDSGILTLSGTLNLGGSVRQITTASDVILTGIVSNGGLSKSGSGTLTMTGANPYTGATEVSGGKLVVNASLANITLTVGSGATLAGSGTIGGATSIQSGGIHAPGNSPGIQTFSHITYQSGSIFSWEIDRTLAQIRGSGYDAVNVLETLDGSNAIFRIVIGDSNFSNDFWSASRSWNDIFTGVDGLTPKANWTTIFGGGLQFYNTSGSPISGPSQGSFSMTGNSLNFSAVPEPSSALGGLLVAAGLLRRRREKPAR